MRKFASKFNNRTTLLLSVIVAFVMFLSIGSAVTTTKDNTDTASIAVTIGTIGVGLPFLKRASDQFRMYNGGGGAGTKFDEESVKELLDKVTTKANEVFSKAGEEFKTEVAALKKKVDEAGTASTEELNKLKTQLETLALEVKAAKETPNKDTAKIPTTLEYLKEGTIVIGSETRKVSDVLKAMMRDNGLRVNFDVKAVGTITTANVTPTTPNGLSPTLTSFEPSNEPIPRVQPFFMDYMNSSPIDSNQAAWAEMKNPEGGAAMTAEGALKSQADFEYVEAKAPVETVTAWIKTSKQALADIQQLRNDIDGELRTLVMLKADGQAFSGDGSTPNLNGIYEQYAQAFTGGSLASSVEAPNEFDVIAAAVNQIATAEVISGTPAGFMATHVFINPSDYTRMLLRKGSDEHYLFPVMLVGMDKIVKIPVVANPLVPAGEFLVGDMSKAHLRLREAINIQVGYVNDDFVKNLVTILAEMRLVTYVKSNHVKAFVKGTFTDAIADLLTT